VGFEPTGPPEGKSPSYAHIWIASTFFSLEPPAADPPEDLDQVATLQ
jgi:hypothetical protein